MGFTLISIIVQRYDIHFFFANLICKRLIINESVNKPTRKEEKNSVLSLIFNEELEVKCYKKTNKRTKGVSNNSLFYLCSVFANVIASMTFAPQLSSFSLQFEICVPVVYK